MKSVHYLFVCFSLMQICLFSGSVLRRTTFTWSCAATAIRSSSPRPSKHTTVRLDLDPLPFSLSFPFISLKEINTPTSALCLLCENRTWESEGSSAFDFHFVFTLVWLIFYAPPFPLNPNPLIFNSHSRGVQVLRNTRSHASATPLMTERNLMPDLSSCSQRALIMHQIRVRC